MPDAKPFQNPYENKGETDTPISDNPRTSKKAYKTNGKSMVLRFAKGRMGKPSKSLMKTKVKRKHRKVKIPGRQKGL